jgi:hypothetical protein
MNATIAAPMAPVASQGKHILQIIREIHTSIGDGLNDNEMMCLLQRMNLPTEAGFTFLSYSDRVVTFCVPAQDAAVWYTEKCWIPEEKERIAGEIAMKHGLSLCKPPDTLYPGKDAPNPHHHLEMCADHESIVVVHPQYLKVRLFMAAGTARLKHGALRPVPLDLNLLEDLAALYQQC